MKDRPVGVTVLAVLAIIGGAIAFCGGLLAFGEFGLGIVGGLLGNPIGAGLAGVYGLLWGSVSVIFGLGLWQMRSWARLATIVVQAINLIYAVISLIGPGSVNWIGAVISIIIIWYLMRPGVQAAFDY